MSLVQRGACVDVVATLLYPMYIYAEIIADANVKLEQ